MSQRDYSQRRRSSRRASGHSLQPQDEEMNGADDIFLMKVVTARMDDSSTLLGGEEAGTQARRRSSTRIADLNFEDPFLREVVMERGNHHRSDNMRNEKTQKQGGYRLNEYHHHPEPQHMAIQIVSPENQPTKKSVTTATPEDELQRMERSLASKSLEGGASALGRLHYDGRSTDPPSRADMHYSQPGAYASAPLHRDTSEEIGTHPARNDNNNRHENSNLDRALEQVESGPVAVESSLVEEPKKSLFKSTACIVAIIIAVIAAATAVVVGVLVAMNQEDPGLPKATMAPTLTKPQALDAFIVSLPYVTRNTIQNQPTSPQAKAYDWITEDINFVSYPLWRLQQRFAMATIYHALEWHDEAGTGESAHTWLHYDKSECDWLPHANPSKACDGKTGNYQYLGLHYLSLMRDNNIGNEQEVGLPPEVSLLSSLESISLQDLTLPPNTTISNLLPTSVQELSNLETLSLINLQMTGTLPPHLRGLKTLRQLDLSGNQISGSLPGQMGQLSQLESLVLEQNNLGGSLPSQMGLWSNLEVLYLQGNNITGTLPSEIGSLASLAYWKAEDNSFLGSVPSQIGLLTSLVNLQWNGNDMTGALPPEIQSLTRLKILGLLGNQITGRVPRELCSVRPQPWIEMNCSLIVCCGKNELE